MSRLVAAGNHLCITGASLVEGSFKQNGGGNDIQYNWTCRRNTNDKLTSVCVASYRCEENDNCGKCEYQGKRVPENSLPKGENCGTRGLCKCLGDDTSVLCQGSESQYDTICNRLSAAECPWRFMAVYKSGERIGYYHDCKFGDCSQIPLGEGETLQSVCGGYLPLIP